MHLPADKQSHRFSVAPMMDWTDRHERAFLRVISSRAFLYTEMVTTGAILFGPKERLLAFDPSEHPVGLQLGGSVPSELADAARIGEEFGYDEINLNIGCPSDRVQSGRFGACLMAEPDLVAEAVAAMADAVSIPVTVKCRIGIDDQDPEQSLYNFVDTVKQSGCETFIVHARKAWLEGLSPKQNRDVPPLDYDLIYRLKQDRPNLEIVINGGIQSLEACDEHLSHVDGVMLGRAAYQSPYLLAYVDQRYFESNEPIASPHEIVERYMPYVEQEFSNGVPVYAMARHMLGLFQGRPGARAWRRHISEYGHKKDATPKIIRDAASLVSQTHNAEVA